MNLVRPTTADPDNVPFYAACETCGWQVYGPLFAAVCAHADKHVDDCDDACVVVDAVEYIGQEPRRA